jgi:hypothetical protein
MKRVEEEQTSTCEEKTYAALSLAVVARVARGEGLGFRFKVQGLGFRV